MIPVALTIAGSDSGGGAGIQADLKTFAAFGVFGTSAITSVTAQNTMRVEAVHTIPAEMVAVQVKAVFADLAVGAIKIGMLGNADIITAVAQSLAGYSAGPIVLDPVLAATSGARLLSEQALDTLITRLLPRTRLLTPNLPEAAALTNSPIAQDEVAMVNQAKVLLGMGAQAVLIKGGHGTGKQSVDLLVDANGTMRFTSERLEVGELHGGGCVFSSAIAAGLARGCPLIASITQAKHFISQAIAAAPSQALGSGARLLHVDRWHGGR
ncbi:bifunctional hydroxymethylpyrimidine kinase/phosphomethylpyrimidine kinase [Devosia sp.]|uniref:bifunctional hydroxymethylpyrimidine kinase/phosphomethylpyrimidine kinase n=1 Tax=Devosia sp. TaxID=1871048 RepID=UPI0027341203|nr:bifunctional hydroxymethylpyrimidine kinase/phosphomethylpyrimidine kinase [Devosia sp.]MDP2778905.1 bifunctional hydroxymethylpyrimidine kinase/phosphomethylpyrimidine kinase [Devosia sp.]